MDFGAALRRDLERIPILHDISSAKGLERKLRRLDRLANTGIFVASAGHEIRNALVAIKTFVEFSPDQNHDAELSAIVRREVERIDSIIGQLLRFAGPPGASFSLVRLHEVLESALRLIQHQLTLHEIDVTRAFNSSNDLVDGDETHLRQAFINLFLNAMEATSGKGSLRITTELVNSSAAGEKLEQQIQLAIQDTGSGISAEDMSHLYEPFFSTKPDGTGLGLAIARHIIHEHGGTIAVESELKKGTIFKIVLPVVNLAD
jgi:signal transduction histidine kinase